MSAALELVKIALQAYGGGDCEITMQLSDPLIRWDERVSRPGGELVWGHDNVVRAMRRYLNSWDEYSLEIEKIAEVRPGRIVGLCRERGIDEAGVQVDRRYGGLWIVEEGKITSWATYLTPREAVGAAKEIEGSRFTPEGMSPGEPMPAPKRTARVKGAPSKKRRRTGKPAKRKSAETSQTGFSEEQRQAAKRRAALARAAREGGRRAPTG
jgi:ketosteroid isomerase-like protein